MTATAPIATPAIAPPERPESETTGVLVVEVLAAASLMEVELVDIVEVEPVELVVVLEAGWDVVYSCKSAS